MRAVSRLLRHVTGFEFLVSGVVSQVVEVWSQAAAPECVICTVWSPTACQPWLSAKAGGTSRG